MNDKVTVYATSEGKLYIRPYELFALKRVQDLIMKVSKRNFIKNEKVNPEEITCQEAKGRS